MAQRGFSCPNCHTWFEGEGNHPRCPLCGTRASPRDLLDDREHHRPAWEEADSAPMRGYELPRSGAPPDYEVPQEAPVDYEVWREEAPDYEVPRKGAPDFELPREGAPDYEVPRELDRTPGYEEPTRSGHAWDYEDPAARVEPRNYEAPAGTTPQPRRSDDSDSSWGDRLGPLIGVLIFLLIVGSRACRAILE